MSYAMGLAAKDGAHGKHIVVNGGHKPSRSKPLTSTPDHTDLFPFPPSPPLPLPLNSTVHTSFYIHNLLGNERIYTSWSRVVKADGAVRKARMSRK